MERTFIETSHSTTCSSVRGLFTPLAAENGSSVSLTTWERGRGREGREGGREEREGEREGVKVS